MNKRFFLLLVMALLVFACGDAGYEADVSKTIDIDPIAVDIEVPALAVGQLVPETPPIDVNTGTIDIGDNDFSDYLSDAELFTINFINYTIDGFPAGSSADLELDVSISINGGADQPLLTIIVPDAQNNVTDVTLYDKNNPGNVNQGTINQLESAIQNGDAFEMNITMTGRDVTLQTQQVNFNLVFAFDVTARIQLVD